MSHKFSRPTFSPLVFTAALALSSTLMWQFAQPANAAEYRCTDRNSGDWYTTDSDESDGDVVCRRQSDSDEDRDDREYRNDRRDRNDSSEYEDEYEDEYGGYEDDENNDERFSRSDYDRGYNDACEGDRPESFGNNRDYAEGYRDAQQERCERPQPWNRNAN